MSPNDDHRSDLELVAAANRGDHAAIEAIYERYRQWVADLAFRLTGDRDLALDVLQEVFLHLVGRFPGFELRARMKTYLHPVVRHIAITLRQRRGRLIPGDARRLDDAARPDERIDALARLVDDLPPGHREVLLLRFTDDLSLGEIAAALEIPVGTVKSRLSNALARLRGELG